MENNAQPAAISTVWHYAAISNVNSNAVPKYTKRYDSMEELLQAMTPWLVQHPMYTRVVFYVKSKR